MRIAVATVGTTGDIAPFVLLARRLVERGHDVTAVTWPVHRSSFSTPGVRVEVAGPHADPARITAVAAEAARRGPMEQVALLREFHLAGGEDHYRRLCTVLAGHDLVVLHGIHALAQAAVIDLDLAWATAVFDPVLLPSDDAPPPGMPGLGPLNGLAWWVLDRSLQRAARPLDDVLSRAGSRQRGLPLFRARSDRLHLLACSAAIVREARGWPAGTRLTGAWLDRSPRAPLPDDLDRFLADGAPPVVVALGSMSGAAEAVIDAAVGAVLAGGRRVVAQGGVAASIESPSLLHAGSVDHRALFPRASAVIHHGGAGTTHAACAAGVPSVVVPHVGDQRYWAERLHRLGVAPRPILVSDLTPEALAEAALATAADADRRHAAAKLGRRLSTEDGLGTAVGLIESIAADA